MFTIIGGDGVEYGPVDAATIKSWIADGRASLQTRARREGEAEWKTLADFAEFSGAGAPPPVPAAALKDPVRIDAEAFAADLVARAKPLDITGCISRGWAFYKSDFWPILGVTLVIFLIAGAIPFGGLIATGLAMAGLYYYYLGKMRGQQRQLPDIFVGLSRMTTPLIVGNLVFSGILFAGTLIAMAVVSVLWLIPSVGLILGTLVGLIVSLGIMYVSIVLTFMWPLMIDKNLDWKDAMIVSRRVIHAQFWRFLGMQMLLFLIMCAGLLALIIGMYFLIPLSFAATAQAYEDLCNPPKAE